MAASETEFINQLKALTRSIREVPTVEYAQQVIQGLLFLRFAELRYQRYADEIESDYMTYRDSSMGSGLARIALRICGLYLPDNARYARVVRLLETETGINTLQKSLVEIEAQHPLLAGQLHSSAYAPLQRQVPDLLKQLASLLADLPSPQSPALFDTLYLSLIAPATAEPPLPATPFSVARLLVYCLEPFPGRALDPACQTGTLLCQLSPYGEYQRQLNILGNISDLFAMGWERDEKTAALARLKLAISGTPGTINDPESVEGAPIDFLLCHPPESYSATDLLTILRTRTAPSGKMGLLLPINAFESDGKWRELRDYILTNHLLRAVIRLSADIDPVLSTPHALYLADASRADDCFLEMNTSRLELTDARIADIAAIFGSSRDQKHRLLLRVHEYLRDGIAAIQAIVNGKEAIRRSLETVATVGSRSEANEFAAMAALTVWRRYGQKPSLDSGMMAYLEAARWEPLSPVPRALTTDQIQRRNQEQRRLTTEGRALAKRLLNQWRHLERDIGRYQQMLEEVLPPSSQTVEHASIQAVRVLLESERTAIQTALDRFAAADWLQQRFPDALYRNVRGLCWRKPISLLKGCYR